jgi:hypothetical protein
MSEAALVAESAQRAAMVDSASKVPASAAPKGGESAEDEMLRRLDSEYGVEDGGGEEESLDFDDKPITWNAEERADGTAGKRQRDGEGRFAKKAEREDRAPDKTQEESQAPAALDPEKMSVAMRALRRDEYTDDDLRGMSDDQILDLGSRRAQAQGKVDGLLDQKSRTDDLGERADPTTATPAAPTAEAGPSVDEARAQLEEVLSELGDTEYGSKVTAALESFVQTATGQSRAPGGDTNGAMLHAILDREQRARLGEDFPALKKDDDLWDKVSDEAEDLFTARIARSPDASPAQRLRIVESSFQDGVRIHLGSAPAKDQERSDRQAARRNRGDGSPTKVESRSAPTKSYETREQLDDAWLNAYENKDDSGLRRIEKQYDTISA